MTTPNTNTNTNTTTKTNSNRNSELRAAAETLNYYDYYFGYLGLSTLQFVEGMVSAFAFGFMIVKLQDYIKLSPMMTNIVAYLSAWYCNIYFTTKAKELDLFKKRTEDIKFIETKGSEYLQDIYYDQNTVHSEPPEDIYQIVKE